MSRYNLIDEKWIPVRFPDGSRDELGIRDTFLRAATITAIEDSSPLVVAGLHRFLLAVLYRALEGPTDIVQARELFRNGLPHHKIETYLQKWRDRFYLFHDSYPFGQNPHVPQKEIEPWTKLTAEFNATSNKVLFDHTDTKNPGSKRPNECARWLLSTMTFSIAGGRGYYPSPSSNCIMCIPTGRDLQATLLFCLVPYPNKEIMSADSAMWEREPKTLLNSQPKRIASGYADLYTWQARMIRLELLPSGEIALMRFIAGDGCEISSNILDPMLPYKSSTTHGNLPIQFREERGTWRDFDSLLPDNDDLAPLTIQNAIRLSNRVAELLPDSILALGQKYRPPNANVDFWRMERFVLPGALAGDRSTRTEIRKLLTEAEDTQKSLWSACRLFARNKLSRGEREPTGKDISDFIAQMPVIGRYWSMLESRFHEVLAEYTLDRDPDDIRCQWLKFVREALQASWEQHRAAVCSGDPWTIRALVKAEASIWRELKKLNEDIVKLES